MSPEQEEKRVNEMVARIQIRKIEAQLRQWMKETKPSTMVKLVDADEFFGRRA